MDAAASLMILLVVAVLVAGPVLAIVALVRTSGLQRLRRAVAEQAVALDALRAEIAGLRRGGATPAEEPARPAPGPPPVPRDVPPRPSATPPPQQPPPPQSPPPQPAPTRQQSPSQTERPPQPPQPPQPPKPRTDWERWVGIRGAALLGAAALGLAGLLFFKYSIEQGLITAEMRVVLGVATGLGCLIGSEVLHRRAYRQTGDALAGAGLVVLYAAFWAAHALYDFVGMIPAFVLMALVTVTGCLLAARRRALVVAAIGLVGGFATPVLLSSGSDRPLGLFGYVLLLDLGLLALGRRRAWPSLALLSLLGTVLLQALWIGKRMGPERMLLGLGIVATFALLFAATSRAGDAPRPGSPRAWTRWGAVLFPFAFAVYFASRVDLGPRLLPLGLLLLLLCGAAAWLGRQPGMGALVPAAATAAIGTLAVWAMGRVPDTAQSWELVGTAVGLAALLHAFVERRRDDASFDGPAGGALIALGGALLLTVFVAARAPVEPAPWLAGWAGLAALAWRQAGFPRRGALQIAAAAGVGLGVAALLVSRAPRLPDAEVALALPLLAAVVLHAAAWARRGTPLAGSADVASVTLPVVLLAGLAISHVALAAGPVAALGGALLLGVLGLVGATRAGRGALAAAALAATLLAQAAWHGVHRTGAEAAVALALLAGTVVLFAVWPVLAPSRFARDRFAWYAAALAGPLWFPFLHAHWIDRFDDGAIGLLPVALGALALGAALGARRAHPGPDAARTSAVAWLSAAALGFVALAIPLQLDKEWVTIGWALQALALLALWRRLDHAGLKWFALALYAAATVRLVANPALLEYYPRSPTPVLNWLLYTYLVPAAALLGGAWLLRPYEVARARPREAALYARGRPIGAATCGGAAILVVFVWINLAVADAFSTGARLTLSFGDEPAQRLALSLAWAAYALVLLGLGMARTSLALRWCSLVFLLITIAKVFLYDLGKLSDLYRVGSLVGLAVSLILVSLLYQRFVFRNRGTEDVP